VITVSKSQHPITFDCSAPGHLAKKETLTSDLSAATVASFLLLDFGIVDAASGAWKKYPAKVTVILQPAPAPPPAAPARRRRTS
jgi:hypothetical protein